MGRDILRSLVNNVLAERGFDELNDESEIGYLPTGIRTFDEEVKGLPLETVTMIAGRPGIGKSSLMMNAIAPQYNTLYIDAEHRWRNSVSDNIVVYSENILENVQAVVNDTLDANKEKHNFDLIIIDSMASLTPQKFYDDDYANDMGLKARANARWFQTLPGHLRGSGVALVIINQVRDTMQAFGVKTFYPGGKALTYACSLILELQGGVADEVKKGGLKVGQKIRAVVKKNTAGPDKREFEMKAMFTDEGLEFERDYKPREKK